MKGLPTSTELAIMKILQDDPHGLYGLQIVERSDGMICRGSVYVLLGRLEERSLVAVRRPAGPHSHPGMARPLYRLTAHGVRTLAALEAAQLAPLGACG